MFFIDLDVAGIITHSEPLREYVTEDKIPKKLKAFSISDGRYIILTQIIAFSPIFMLKEHNTY